MTQDYVPTIKRFPVDAPREKFIEALEKDGLVVVTGFATDEELDQSLKEVKPYLDNDVAWDGKLWPPETKRCTRLIGRSETVREKFFAHELVQDMAEEFLNLTTTNYYDQTPTTYTSKPLLSISMTMDIRPGATGQRIHRDDKNHHARHVKSDKYIKNNDVLFGLMVPCCDTTVANGATRVIPGSHLWGDERAPLQEELIYAEMKKGECLLMVGSLYHCGSPNNTTDENRPVHIIFMCDGVHRQEEISYLSYPIKDVKNYSKIVQERLGWKSSAPNLGWVDMRSPEFLLQDSNDNEIGHEDLDDAPSP
ncbi:hypothetical protein BVG19_g1342 [[Candida] boidinii]|nr:hypothetical protein BVG19_g1342 [[Candida] boidinii]OWB49033.1 hypothetical protein B5S27_g572 [[Candida] boidinii]